MENKLLDVSIDGAKGILFNITGGNDLSLFEIHEAVESIRQLAHPDVNLIFGAVIDDRMKDSVRVTVIATNFENVAPPKLNLGRRNTPTNNWGSTPSVNNQPTSTPKQEDQSVFNDQSTDYEVPAFLRRRDNNNNNR